MPAHIELIATGSELLSGRCHDRHTAALARALRPLGGILAAVHIVPDDLAALRSTVQAALARSDLLFISGGLGPTCDDLTREAVADVLGRRVILDEASVARIRAWCDRTGRAMNDSRASQARVVEGAEVLPNPVGAAPGQRLEHEGRTLYLLPGPPPEFDAILSESVLPRLARLRPGGMEPVAENRLWICGPGESDIVARLERADFDPGPVAVAYCAAPGCVELRLTGAPGRDGLAAVARAAARARAVLGDDVFAEGAEGNLAAVAGDLLRARGGRLAVAESCTGGGLGQRLTEIRGSSDWFAGGVIAYANEVKTRVLDVPPDLLAREGAVSAPVAAQMACAARRLTGATHALSITGIAGPGGGTPEKPVGLVYLGLDDDAGSVVRRHVFSGTRAMIRTWSIQFALDLLRRRLQAVLR